MVGSAEKLGPFCGAMRRLTVRYDRVFLVLYRTATHLLVLSLEPQVDQQLLDQIGNAVRKLELAVAEENDQ